MLAALALVLIPTTVIKGPLFMACGRLLIGGLAIHLVLCTARHWRRLAWCVRLIHAGVLIILIGTLWGRAGFVATINSYEGDAISSAFRWDRQEDTALGFTLVVKKIDRDYYPVPIRVGVIIDGQATTLYERRSGEGFNHAGFRVDLLDFDPRGPALHLAVTDLDGVRKEQTATREIPVGQPGLVCQLVAFQTPVVKRSWVDLEISSGDSIPFVGQAEVNHPLHWQGLRFYHTATNVDPSGRAYAGIQIVNDQGIPLVYLGFLIVSLGNGLLLYRKSRRRGPYSSGHAAISGV